MDYRVVWVHGIGHHRWQHAGAARYRRGRCFIPCLAVFMLKISPESGIS